MRPEKSARGMLIHLSACEHLEDRSEVVSYRVGLSTREAARRAASDMGPASDGVAG